MLDRVLIAARGPRAPVAARIDALARWYGVRAESREVAGGAVTVAALGTTLGSSAAFQESPPPMLAVLDAEASELRRYEGGGATLAASADRARIVAGAGAPACLYAASSGEVDAWATHAVAAAFVAQGTAAIEPLAIPELLAFEFVGDSRSLVAGARALDAAACVDLSATRAEEWCYWPARERWAPVPEEDAYEHAEAHLLRSLDIRLRGAGRPHSGLTAGLDSRVAALALDELGMSFEGYTWGSPDDEDVIGGSEVSAALGAPHHTLGFETWSGAEALRQTRSLARWTEGAIHVGFGNIAWPGQMQAFVTGGGGETGRCFYYRDHARERPPDDLAGVVVDQLAGRIAGARREATAALDDRVRAWVAAAEQIGHSGWRALDVVYGEQRVRRWLRGMLPHGPAPMVPAFATPEVQRALVSLPLAERRVDGFHRRFIEARRADLLPPASAGTTAGGRRPLARISRRLRQGRLDGEWRSRPEYREWIADGVLGHPLAVEAMGERWCRRTRSRFFAGDQFAVERALWLGGPVALAEALGELRE